MPLCSGRTCKKVMCVGWWYPTPALVPVGLPRCQQLQESKNGGSAKQGAALNAVHPEGPCPWWREEHWCGSLLTQPQPVSGLGCSAAETNTSISPWLHVACTGGLLLISTRSHWQELLERRLSSNCYSCLSSFTCACIFLKLIPFGSKFSMLHPSPVTRFC